MINTDEIVEEDLPPAEFMESYSRLRKRYQEELAAVRDVCFHEYVEPILVEEEAIAQIQLWLRKNNWIHKKVRIIFRFLFLRIIFKLLMIVFLP